MNDVKMTDNGRTVYGGGGITPDEKYEAPKLNKFQIEVLRKFALFNFSAQFFGAKPGHEAAQELGAGREPGRTTFHQFMLKNGVEFTEANFTENHQWVKEQLKHEIYITAFGLDESERVQDRAGPGSDARRSSPCPRRRRCSIAPRSRWCSA